MELSEHIKTATVEKVLLTQPLQPPATGTLCVTGHHLIFSGSDGHEGVQLQLLLRNVDGVEKRCLQVIGSGILGRSAVFRDSSPSPPGTNTAGTSSCLISGRPQQKYNDISMSLPLAWTTAPLLPLMTVCLPQRSGLQEPEEADCEQPYHVAVAVEFPPLVAHRVNITGHLNRYPTRQHLCPPRLHYVSHR
ncbi:myotubularin-related protein 9-like [Arapaima gigas]